MRLEITTPRGCIHFSTFQVEKHSPYPSRRILPVIFATSFVFVTQNERQLTLWNLEGKSGKSEKLGLPRCSVQLEKYKGTGTGLEKVNATFEGIAFPSKGANVCFTKQTAKKPPYS